MRKGLHPLFRRLAVPLDSHHIVLRDATAICVHFPKQALCACMPLFSRLAVPLDSHHIVLRNTTPI